MTKVPLPPVPAEADNSEQSRRFIETAREVAVDESPGAFDRVFRKITVPAQRERQERQRQRKGPRAKT